MKTSTRNERIKAQYLRGDTLETIGKRYGISRERARQVLFEAGITYAQSGRHALRKEAVTRRQEERRIYWDHRSMKHYGCPLNFAKAYPWPVRKAYLKQHSNAVQRGIPWQLTFLEWAREWERSGKLALRGRTKGHYVMARLGDTGPYAVGNVRIISCSENVHEAIENLKAKGIPWGVNHPKHKASRRRKQLCLPIE